MLMSSHKNKQLIKFIFDIVMHRYRHFLVPFVVSFYSQVPEIVPTNSVEKLFHCWIDRLKEYILVNADYFGNIYFYNVSLEVNDQYLLNDLSNWKFYTD